MVSSGVTKPAKSSSRRLPPTGARRPTRAEFLGARKHASTKTGPRAAPVHRGSPGQGRTLLRGPKAVSNPLDEPITRPAPSRKRKGACKGDEPETNAERSAATQRQRVDALVAEIPREVLDRALGGASARLQVPDPVVRESLQRQLLTSRGGPTGDLLHKALRSWRLLVAAAKQQGLPDHGLPATGALVAQVVAADFARARRQAVGSKGGASVGKTIREGFVALQDLVGLPIDAHHPLVEAAAEPPPEMRAKLEQMVPKQAASLPLCVQLQLETLAARPTWSVVRTTARALLTACVVHHIRLNDALNAVLLVDERQPDNVCRARAVLKAGKKAAKPIELYAPAAGWLGPFAWLEEHIAELAGRKHALPDYEGSKPSTASTLRKGVLSKARARAALQDLCAQEPLCLSAEAFKAMGVTTHSPHGSGPDMARFVGSNGAPFNEEDARELGHWLRDRNAPQGQADPRQVPGAPSRNQREGQPVARGIMSLHYSSGSGRRGERGAQLAVRARLNEWVRGALARYRKPWLTLPPTLDSWDILVPADAPARLAGLW
jgi:hypothetical protein